MVRLLWDHKKWVKKIKYRGVLKWVLKTMWLCFRMKNYTKISDKGSSRKNNVHIYTYRYFYTRSAYLTIKHPKRFVNV